MGIEVVCGGCGEPIGMNRQTAGAPGYCMKCTANMQLQAQMDEQLRHLGGTRPNEKEVKGERVFEKPKLIGEG